MNFGLLIVGDEILSGKRADKHLPKVIELLAARGLQLAWARYVGDDPAGSPPTSSDAFASGDSSFVRRHRRHARRPHPPVRRGRARRSPRTPSASAGPGDRAHAGRRARAGQGLRSRSRGQPAPAQHGGVPEGAEIIPNPYNKIAGFALAGGGAVFFVPGFPVMAWPMIEWVLDTRFRHLHGTPRRASAR